MLNIADFWLFIHIRQFGQSFNTFNNHIFFDGGHTGFYRYAVGNDRAFCALTIGTKYPLC